MFCSLGCVFVVSTGCADPVAELRSLSAAQQRHQHEKPAQHPVFFSANILRYYVLVQVGWPSTSSWKAFIVVAGIPT